MTSQSQSRQTVLLTLVATMAMAVVWGTRVDAANPTLVSVFVTPADPTIAVGAQVALEATGNFDDATQRQLGRGGQLPRWHVLFQPNIDVSACAAMPPVAYCCQDLRAAADGTFHEVWSLSSPNTLSVDGALSPSTLTASLSCAQTGTQTGSLNATWNGTHYSGSFTFGGSGEILVKGLTWSSSEPSVATVDATGMVRGVAPGTAIITATFGSTCSASEPEPPAGCVGTVVGTSTVSVIAAVGPPGPPPGLLAEASGNVVRFTWLPPTIGTAPTFYELVGRQTSGDPILATLGVGNVTTTTLTVPNGSFFITVRGANAQGAGAESSGVIVNLPAPVVPPGPPTNLTREVNGTTVGLAWGPPENNPPGIGYRLVASATPGGSPIASVSLPVGQTSLVVTAVPPGTYFVRVVATSLGPDSAPSNEVIVTVAAPQAPAAPTLNPAEFSGPIVTLSWTPAPTGPPATSYVITVSLSAGGSAIATVPVGGTIVSASALPGTYFVRVTAVNAAGASAPSNEITVVVP